RVKDSVVKPQEGNLPPVLVEQCEVTLRGPGRCGHRNAHALGPMRASRDWSSNKLASGRQAKRSGANCEVPRPAETWSHVEAPPPLSSGRGPGQPCRPLARPVSISQLVTRAP